MDNLNLIGPTISQLNRPYNLIGPTISQLNESALANILLYDDSKKSASESSKILQSTIKYIFATKRLECSYLNARFILYLH